MSEYKLYNLNKNNGSERNSNIKAVGVNSEQMKALISRDSSEELSNHGILGQKWGVRRYQNADGTLTEEGKKKYNKEFTKDRLNRNLSYKQILDKYSENGFLKNLSEDPGIKESIRKAKISSVYSKEYERFLEDKKELGEKIIESEAEKMKKLNQQVSSDILNVGKNICDYFGTNDVYTIAYISFIEEYVKKNKKPDDELDEANYDVIKTKERLNNSIELLKLNNGYGYNQYYLDSQEAYDLAKMQLEDIKRR